MESQMSTEPDKRCLTLDDPVDAETLEQFQQLQDARQRFAENLLLLEQEKIQILHAVKKIDDQRNRLFEASLVARGLTPGTNVEIDARTRKMSLAGTDAPEPDLPS